ncbi:hypothetical protein Celaphus_00013400 [Cervus elaphus hippelaphus]|uniref:Uncharacterized protein n=1 Tax=Cervus elaphus hippelaphus TaxID=46360 RepID=A0A212DGT9_CEREH|nr:hypothetical protein Celaphus_00013400 [Cervus elaphus hippelaphus]
MARSPKRLHVTKEGAPGRGRGLEGAGGAGGRPREGRAGLEAGRFGSGRLRLPPRLLRSRGRVRRLEAGAASYAEPSCPAFGECRQHRPTQEDSGHFLAAPLPCTASFLYLASKPCGRGATPLQLPS